MTGKFAYVVVCQYIESITLSKLVLKKLSKENKDYKVLYKKVNEAQSALLKEVLDTVEYEEESKLTDFSEDVETFKRKIIQRITTRMISSIAKQDISEIMQCKKDMVPFISSTTVDCQPKLTHFRI